VNTNNNIDSPAIVYVAIVSTELPARVAWLLGGELCVDFRCDGADMTAETFVARSEFDVYDLTLWAGAAMKGHGALHANVRYLLRLSPAPDAAERQELCEKINAALGLGYCYLVDNQ
jgi:hypothetical protein